MSVGADASLVPLDYESTLRVEAELDDADLTFFVHIPSTESGRPDNFPYRVLSFEPLGSLHHDNDHVVGHGPPRSPPTAPAEHG